MNQSSVTLPLGAEAPPATLTKSCTVELAATVVTVACAALWMSVETVGFSVSSRFAARRSSVGASTLADAKAS